MRTFIAAFLVTLAGCESSLLTTGEPLNPVNPMNDGGTGPGRPVSHPDLAVTAKPDLAMPPAVDDATIISAVLPAMLGCGDAFAAEVVVHNAGTTTWTAAEGYRLGAVGDFDPLKEGAPRVNLPDGVRVAPGGDYTFTFALKAPVKASNQDTRWQMLRENVRWFGAIASHNVVIACADPFNFAQATIQNSPADIANWPETAKITVLDLQAAGAHIDFTKKDGMDSWPDVPFGMPGDSLEYTLWIVLHINGKWYASGCIEYWRGLDRNGGPPSQYAMNWYYDKIRWGNMVGYQPAVGEQVGFLVSAGDARNNGNAIVKERSNVVFVPFPDDNGAKFVF